jgi:glycosyltransferase involved in cell wall biosynthesis
MKLSVVMPCLNEAETLASCIRKAQRSLTDLAIQGEVLIADNGSSDGSQELARSLGARVVDIAQKGYGHALRGGIEAAAGKFIIMADSDDSYDFSKLGPFVEKLQAGHDLVMGCRMPWGGGTVLPGAMPWKHRWIGNPVLSFIGRLFFKCPVTDFHCGLRGFTKAAYLKMDLRTTGMELASEMVIKATLQGMKITEVPITLHPDGRSRPPHLRSWRDGWRHLRFMMLFSPRWLFLIPGISLGAVGGLFLSLLAFQPLSLGPVVLDINSMLVAAMMLLVGFQLIYSAVFLRIYGFTQGFLPDQPQLRVWLRRVTLEKGVITGVFLALAGFFLLLLASLKWKSTGFGALDPVSSVRQVVPAVTLLTLGVQVVFGSFFLSSLGINRPAD